MLELTALQFGLTLLVLLLMWGYYMSKHEPPQYPDPPPPDLPEAMQVYDYEEDE